MYISFTKAGKESAEKLANALGAPMVYGPDQPNFHGQLVFNYGCSYKNKTTKEYINKPDAVRIAINKILTLAMCKATGLPTVDFVLNKKDIPKTWHTIVARTKIDGKENDGMEIIIKGDPIPDAPLYTHYFDHKFEFRIVVFKGKVAHRYLKKRNKGMWEFMSLDPEGFSDIDTVAIKATENVGLDYAGVDIIAKNPTNFRLLEVNSAPIITTEVIKFIKENL